MKRVPDPPKCQVAGQLTSLRHPLLPRSRSLGIPRLCCCRSRAVCSWRDSSGDDGGLVLLGAWVALAWKRGRGRCGTIGYRHGLENANCREGTRLRPTGVKMLESDR